MEGLSTFRHYTRTITRNLLIFLIQTWYTGSTLSKKFNEPASGRVLTWLFYVGHIPV